MLRLPIGISDFETLREEGCHFVDKSLFIQEVLVDEARVQLITRPRRFGKTLNLSMLASFLRSKPDKRRELFKGLSIAASPLMKRPAVPVVFLSLKDAKRNSYKGFLRQFAKIMSKLYLKFSYLQAGLSAVEVADFERVLNRSGDEEDLISSLGNLLEWLRGYHQQRVVVLIDEYDAPVYEAREKGFYEDVVSVLRGFLGQALKDNDTNLSLSVLTGILKITKESIFSDLNNLRIHTVLDASLGDKFGFTDEEVRHLLELAGRSEQWDTVQTWYGGYFFGGAPLLNPWSVLNYLSLNETRPQAHWVNTGSNLLIYEQLTKAGPRVHQVLYRLLLMERMEADLSIHMVFPTLEWNGSALWGLLVSTGYLSAPAQSKENSNFYMVAVPNQEIASMIRDIFLRWFSIEYHTDRLDTMLMSLVRGQFQDFELLLGELVVTVLSYYDTADQQPERVYHLFVLGLMVRLNQRYKIRSNRESGYGRYDICLEPKKKGDPGIILEFKTFEGDDPGSALTEAQGQIKRQKYAAELLAAGVTHRHEVAVACNGKRVFVAGQTLTRKT